MNMTPTPHKALFFSGNPSESYLSIKFDIPKMGTILMIPCNEVLFKLPFDNTLEVNIW